MRLEQLYLFTVILPNINATLSILFFSLIVGALVSLGRGAALYDDDDAKQLFRHARKIFLWAGIVAIISIPFPCDKQLYTLAGGYVATNTKDIAKLPDNVVKAANAWLKKSAEVAKPATATK